MRVFSFFKRRYGCSAGKSRPLLRSFVCPSVPNRSLCAALRPLPFCRNKHRIPVSTVCAFQQRVNKNHHKPIFHQQHFILQLISLSHIMQIVDTMLMFKTLQQLSTSQRQLILLEIDLIYPPSFGRV